MIDFSLFCSTFRVDAMRTIAVQLKHLYSTSATSALSHINLVSFCQIYVKKRISVKGIALQLK